MARYIQPRRAPTRKVGGALMGAAVGGSGGAATLVWLASQVGVDLPAPVAVFLAGMIGTALGGYLPTERLQSS